MSGFWKIGTSGFGNSSVSGRSLVPSPAPRTNACLISAIALKIPNGRGDDLARQRFAMEKFRVFPSPATDCDRHLIVVAVLEQSGPEVRKFSVFIMLLLAVPIFIAGKRYLQTKCTVYE